jgi:hypothetical protein
MVKVDGSIKRKISDLREFTFFFSFTATRFVFAYFAFPFNMRSRAKLYPNILRLFDLVKSLTQEETDALLLYASAWSRDPESIEYIKLFRCLQACATRDKKEIKRIYTERGHFKTSNAYNLNQHYLYTAILRIIRHTDDTSYAQLLGAILEARALVNRGQASLAIEFCDDAIQFAESIEEYQLQLMLLAVKRSAVTSPLLPSQPSETLENISAQEASATTHLALLRAWEALHQEVSMARRLPTAQREATFRKLRESPLLTAGSAPAMARAAVLYHTITWHLAQVPVPQAGYTALKPLQSVIELINARPSLLEDDNLRQTYLKFCKYLAYYAVYFEKWPEVTRVLQFLEAMISKPTPAAERVLEMRFLILVYSAIHRNDIKDCNELRDDFLTRELRYHHALPLQWKLEAAYHLARGYTKWGDYSSVVKIVNTCRHGTLPEIQPQFFQGVWLYFLIAQLSQGNKDLLKAGIHDAELLFKGTALGTQFFMAFLEFLRPFCGKRPPKRNHITSFAESWISALAIEENKYLDDSFDFSGWLLNLSRDAKM